MLNELEEFFQSTRVSLDKPDTVEKLKKQLHHACYSVEQVIPDLRKFSRTEPQLPDDHNKSYNNTLPVTLKDVSSALEALEKISALRESNESCDLAFSVFRDTTRSPWKPFLKTALERNPVSVNGTKNLSIDAAYNLLIGLPGESIYGEPSRIAQPDEVWNYQRGDGLEKAPLERESRRAGPLLGAPTLALVALAPLAGIGIWYSLGSEGRSAQLAGGAPRRRTSTRVKTTGPACSFRRGRRGPPARSRCGGATWRWRSCLIRSAPVPLRRMAFPC